MFKAIPVVAAKVPSTQTDFPVYIQPSAMTGWGSITLAEAQSSRWYSDEAKTVELAREIVSADEIHVKVPSLTTTTTLYVDYDGIRADYAVTDTYGRNAVWSSLYNGVFHNGDLSTTTVEDSTGNGRTGTKGAANQPIEAVGKINDGQNFTNTSWRIDHGQVLGNGNNLTISFWVKFNALSNGRVISKAAASNYQYSILVFTDGNIYINQWTSAGSNYRGFNSTTSSFTTGVWGYVTVVLREGASNASIIYKDGSSLASSTATSGTWATTVNGNFRQGQRGDGANDALNGTLDEVRVAPTNLSANWITTEYNNQNDVATFWGTVTDAGGAPVANNGFMVWL